MYRGVLVFVLANRSRSYTRQGVEPWPVPPPTTQSQFIQTFSLEPAADIFIRILRISFLSSTQHYHSQITTNQRRTSTMKSFALLVLSTTLIAANTPAATLTSSIRPSATTPCPTVISTSTVCPYSCTWPTCVIRSTLTAHCGCPNPPATWTYSWTCSDGCSAKPGCSTAYTVQSFTYCKGPTSSSASSLSSLSSKSGSSGSPSNSQGSC